MLYQLSHVRTADPRTGHRISPACVQNCSRSWRAHQLRTGVRRKIPRRNGGRRPRPPTLPAVMWPPAAAPARSDDIWTPAVADAAHCRQPRRGSPGAPDAWTGRNGVRGGRREVPAPGGPRNPGPPGGRRAGKLAVVRMPGGADRSVRPRRRHGHSHRRPGRSRRSGAGSPKCP